MSGSSRSRQKRKLEPISLEELAGTTGMSGFCTFLTRDASVPVPALDEAAGPMAGAPPPGAVAPPPSTPDSTAPDLNGVESTAPVSSASTQAAVHLSAADTEAVELGAPDSTAPVSSPQKPTGPPLVPAAAAVPPVPVPTVMSATRVSAPVFHAPDSDAVDFTAPERGAPESSAFEFRRERRLRIREAVTVQDGHSLAEQAVYDAMYRAGKPYQGDSRILTIGLRTLAELSRMAYSNCKLNVRSLVAKLAIDESTEFSYTEGRTYVIYSFREILRRRKAAGLTHVVRTRGVAFVDPVTGTELSAHQSSALDSSGSALAPSRSSAPEPAESSALASGANIRNRHLISNSGEASSSSSAVPAVVSALRRHIPDVDDDAAAELWRRCLENAPDARIDEVIHFIDLKAGKPGIRMPLGFLLAAVPKCFAGDAFRQFRGERAQGREANLARERLFAGEILKNPDADEEQRQWAREILGL
jgi:hypothetical protein